MLPIANSSLMAGVSTVSLFKYRPKESMRFGKNNLKGIGRLSGVPGDREDAQGLR